MKNEKSRWKIDYEDLKGWLADTIDAWLIEERSKIEEKNDQKYKAIILKQKNEIEALKKKTKTVKWGAENSAPDVARSAPPTRGRYPEGSKEDNFVKRLEEVKPRVDSLNVRNKEECKWIENKLVDMNNEIQQWELTSDVTVQEIEQMKKEGKDALAHAKAKAEEFDNFENTIKDRLKEINEEIAIQGSNEAQEVQELEGEVKSLFAQKWALTKGSVNHWEQKLWEMRIPFSSLDKMQKWMGEY